MDLPFLRKIHNSAVCQFFEPHAFYFTYEITISCLTDKNNVKLCTDRRLRLVQ